MHQCLYGLPASQAAALPARTCCRPTASQLSSIATSIKAVILHLTLLGDRHGDPQYQTAADGKPTQLSIVKSTCTSVPTDSFALPLWRLFLLGSLSKSMSVTAQQLPLPLPTVRHHHRSCQPSAMPCLVGQSHEHANMLPFTS